MKIVGVTACPAGIAHTYMAQEAIEKECKSRGYDVKIETQGSMGIENELEQDEIDEADAVILAIAINVDGEERFEEIFCFKKSIPFWIGLFTFCSILISFTKI